ncbi:hypothetical protein ADUPG1_005252, partial [Aduncisulcus paluster]
KSSISSSLAISPFTGSVSQVRVPSASSSRSSKGFLGFRRRSKVGSNVSSLPSTSTPTPSSSSSSSSSSMDSLPDTSPLTYSHLSASLLQSISSHFHPPTSSSLSSLSSLSPSITTITTLILSLSRSATS